MSAPSPRPRVRRLDLATYVRSEDFFEAVRDAARERASILGTISSMEGREGLHAQGYEAMGRSGAVRDRMAATDDRMDYESSRAPLLAEDDAIIRLANSLIWGGDGGDLSGGVASLAGERVATAMEMRYVHALTWAEAARRMKYSPRSGQVVADLCRVGLDIVDSHLLTAVARGEGSAT